jgi:catechol 2,3-dioxygenase-like lactoylglutathione lyase family enzyme
MEDVIHDLLGGYEKGALSRRELIGALAVLAATTQTASAAAAGFEGSSINHVSIVVSNLDRSVDWYRRVFGLSVLSENKKNQLVQLKVGKSTLAIRHQNGPTGVDHFAIGLDHFDKAQVIADLKARGAIAIDGGGASVHVLDPDGQNIQLIKNS